MARPTTKNEFLDVIKRKLGADFIPVNLSEGNWDDILNDALDYFSKNVYNFSKDGIYILDTTKDSSEYTLPDNIFSVMDVLDKALWTQLYYKFPTREFDTVTVQFISSLARFPGNKMMDAEIALQNLSAFVRQFVPKAEWSFDFFNHKMIFHSAPGNNTVYLFCSYLLDYNGTSTSGIWTDQLFQNYTTALAKIQWTSNLMKFKDFQLPGGGTINIDGIRQEGLEEKKEIEAYIQEHLFDFINL
jgi:hypothetical protein